MTDPVPGQSATGSYIAQASDGATAIVATYHVAPPPPVDAAALASADQLLSQLPTGAVPPVAALPPTSRMPLPRNELFTGRTTELRLVAACLGSSVDQAPTVVVAGLGGVGKSQIATEYAHRYGRFYAGGVLWLNLSDPTTVAGEVAACGGVGGMNLRPDFAALSPEEQRDLVRAAWQSPLPRLLVFDNCESEETLAQWRPASGGCRVLVTSRRSDWDPTLGVDVVGLDVLPVEDSRQLLQRYRAPESPADAEALAAIAVELGQLPLALHLGGSYLRRYRTAISPAAYLVQLRTGPLIEHRSLTAAGISPTQHIQSIAATFAISVDRLAATSRDDAAARSCLLCASYMAPGEGIPRALLLETLGLAASPEGDIALEDALQRLAEFGLVQLSEDGTPRLHRLVAAFVRDRLGDDQSLFAVENAVWDALTPRLHTLSPPALAQYGPHLRVLTERALPRRDLLSAALANYFGLFLLRQDDRVAGRDHLLEALQIREELFGVNSPQTATFLNNVGYSYLGTADRALGLPYLERARQLWDPTVNGPDLAGTLDNLGQIRMGLGRDDLAGPLFREALEIRERELGENAYGTSVTVMNLAQLAARRGDLDGSARLYRRAVAIREAIGERSEASSTALSHVMLANTLDMLGDTAAATSHVVRAFELQNTSLGPTHPRTQWLAVQAAQRLLEAGGAVDDRALNSAFQALDAAVSETSSAPSGSAADLNNLGFAFWLRGEYAAARRTYEMAMSDGVEATALNNLGMIDERLGDHTGAIAHYRNALAALDVVDGGVALRARVVNNLGVSLAMAGDVVEAERCLGRALALRRQLQGDDGPDVAVTLRNLGLVALRAGQLDDAARLMGRARDSIAGNQGVRSAEYARTMRLLGDLDLERGDDESALRSIGAALDIGRVVFGPTHPETAVTQRAYGQVLRRLGRAQDACAALEEALPVFERHMGPAHAWTVALRQEVGPCPGHTSSSPL